MKTISMASNIKIYHNNNCMYVKRILPKNLIRISRNDAERQGFVPCKYCNSMKVLYRAEEKNLEKYANQNGLLYTYADDKLLVRSELGWWKILYNSQKQYFVLWHGNYSNGNINQMKIKGKSAYHFQKDVPYAKTIMEYFIYIKTHDDFRKVEIEDYKKLPRTSKKQKKYYERVKRKKIQMDINRVNIIFAKLERENAEYKHLSVW